MPVALMRMMVPVHGFERFSQQHACCGHFYSGGESLGQEDKSACIQTDDSLKLFSGFRRHLYPHRDIYKPGGERYHRKGHGG